MTMALARRNSVKPTRKERITQSRASGNVARRQSLPEYLEAEEVDALMVQAPHAQARFLMLVQWRAAPRVSEVTLPLKLYHG